MVSSRSLLAVFVGGGVKVGVSVGLGEGEFEAADADAVGEGDCPLFEFEGEVDPVVLLGSCVIKAKPKATTLRTMITAAAAKSSFL